MKQGLLRCTLPGVALLAFWTAGAHAQVARSNPSVVIEPGKFDVRGTSVPVEYGRMSVPANRGSASATTLTLTLRFVRFRSTAAVPGAPIVFLAGGPGDAATRAFQGMPVDFLNQLRAIADVIAFDQRGTGTSEPLNPRCPPGPPLPRDRPAAPWEMLPSLQQRVRDCLVDVARNRVDVTGLTTAESADDLDDLRRAIGARTLSLLAGSYGTHLAIATARRHPAAVDRMALLGVEGPDHTFKLPTLVDQAIARIAASRQPSLIESIKTLRTRLAAQPARFTFPGGQVIVLGKWDLQRWIAESLDSSREIDALLVAIPAMLAGEYAPLAQWALRYRMPRPINLMNLAMDCASFASSERLQRIRQEAATALLGDAINFPLPGLCEVSGLPRLPDSFRAPLISDVKALLVSGTFDGRTPVQNAIDVARGLPNARPVVIEGASHGLFQDAQVLRDVLEFLVNPCVSACGRLQH